MGRQGKVAVSITYVICSMFARGSILAYAAKILKVSSSDANIQMVDVETHTKHRFFSFSGLPIATHIQTKEKGDLGMKHFSACTPQSKSSTCHTCQW